MTVVDSPAAGQHPADVVELTIGRAQTCDVSIPADPYVSPRHARLLVYRDQRVFVEDLGTTNGVYVHRGSQHIKVRMSLELHPKDVIRVGRTLFPVLDLLARMAGR